MSLSWWKIHLSIFLYNTSTYAKNLLVGNNVFVISLKHAYNVHPYNNTLRTKAFINNNLTLILVIPTILQLVQIELKLLLANLNLSYRIASGYMLLLLSLMRKYLNSLTVSIY